MSVRKKNIIANYVPAYLEYLEIEKGLSCKSQENYARFLKKFLSWLAESGLGGISPAQLTPDHVYRYRVFLSRHVDPRLKAPLKRSTQNYYLIALRSLLEYFIEKDIPALPPGKIKLAKDKSDKEVKFLTLNQIEELLVSPDISTEQGLRDRAILEALFSTGLRVAELVRLSRDQFRFKNASQGLEIAVVGKGGKVRTVYFSQRAARWLETYLTKRRDIDPALFINYKRGTEKLPASRRLTTRAVEDIVKKYVKISGVPIMASPHTLRHSYATDLLMNGVDLRMVQEFLGHRNIATTQIYTHVTNKKLKDIHDKFHGGRQLKDR